MIKIVGTIMILDAILLKIKNIIEFG